MSRDSGAKIISLAVPDDGKPGHCALGLTGVTTDARTQFTPLLPVLGKIGPVDGLDYVGNYFSAKAAKTKVANYLASVIGSGGKVTLVGASLGACLVPFILILLGRQMDLKMVRENLKIILIDPPSGAGTMKDIPRWISGPVALIVQLFALLIRIPWIGYMANKYIHDPTLHGHKPTMFLTQLAWMVSQGGRTRPHHILRGFDVTYIACDGSSVVRNPAAMRHWVKDVRNTVSAGLPHCEFETFTAEYNQLLAEILLNN